MGLQQLEHSGGLSGPLEGIGADQHGETESIPCDPPQDLCELRVRPPFPL